MVKYYLDEIRTMQKRQDEHENHLMKKTEEMQGNEILCFS